MKTCFSFWRRLGLITVIAISIGFLGCSKESTSLTTPNITAPEASLPEPAFESLITEYTFSENISADNERNNAAVSFNLALFNQTVQVYLQAVKNAAQYFRYVGGANPTQDVWVFGTVLANLQNALNLNASLRQQLTIALSDPRYASIQNGIRRDIQTLKNEYAQLQQLFRGFQMKYNVAVQQKRWQDQQVTRLLK